MRTMVKEIIIPGVIVERLNFDTIKKDLIERLEEMTLE